ncbi:hypothetical protein Rleg4DRAFT_2394 [Rhizobium leguminosarum bv. trifolii WSM2297]|uniref:Uncharacterized protein n=1 Tax=Rhizobium leguminosarum bv. trifolii WSM2297 TaxID=754762 RepID=J0KT27_RHILT|nr:hypothetical protein Rleg4DRAFT_2394 [Rhizobium leguminosarum bv. trifolii WSM2297]
MFPASHCGANEPPLGDVSGFCPGDRARPLNFARQSTSTTMFRLFTLA